MGEVHGHTHRNIMLLGSGREGGLTLVDTHLPCSSLGQEEGEVLKSGCRPEEGLGWPCE